MPEWTHCANANEICDFEGAHEVRYGKGNAWTPPVQMPPGFVCRNATFGHDPAFGVVKECQIRPYVPPVVVEPEPEPTTTPAPTSTQQPQAGGISTTTWLLIGGALLLMMGSGGRSR